MPPPEVVLIDTSALYALISSADEFHAPAAATYQALIDREQNLLVTSYVLVEATALMHRRLGFESLMLLADSIRGLVGTFWIEESIHSAAWEAFTRRRGEGLSFVDWTTVIAARRATAHVFTFDAGFKQENVAVVPRP